jgi:para-aminobenzoate synthetase / 4-amino-4-deoxychorismate lyase
VTQSVPSELRPDVSQGVFETMLVREGSPLELDQHLSRLTQSVTTLFGRQPPADIVQLVLENARAVELGRLRLDVAPDATDQLAARVRVQAVDEKVVFPVWEQASDLCPVLTPGGIGGHKWADRRFLEKAETEASPAVPLLVDRGDDVLEASRANLFIVERGAIVTPPCDGRILPGVTRQCALVVARSIGFQASEEAVSMERLLAADELFLTGAVRGIEPVQAVLDLRAWTEVDGISKAVADALRRAWSAAG